jgi:hypothetical protein
MRVGACDLSARLPGAPPASSNEPIDIATPTRIVATVGLMNRIVSWIASLA